MTLYTLTYQFESSGGNIEYQTTQQVQKAATATDTEMSLVTTGIAIDGDMLEGTAIVDVSDTLAPADSFASATDVRRVSFASTAERTDRRQPAREPPADPHPANDIQRFEGDEAMADLLIRVSDTPGCGFLLDSNLTRCHPFERDLWFVTMSSTVIDETSETTTADVVEFYRDNRDRLEDEPALRIGGFHGVADPNMRLCLVASLTDPEEARTLAERTTTSDPMNFYRFELAKASMVVGESTHGPGQVAATFRNTAGDEVCSRDLVYRTWQEGLNVSYHPLGVAVDGDLYRPVIPDPSAGGKTVVGDPILVDTYRGSSSKPWQFGVTRQDEQLLITQARGPPDKFDPVLKRFPIETQPVGTEPLVFSHTVSRRLWSEDPLNLHVQSQRSEGLRTQFLYADGKGWHLIQPKALGEPREPADGSFEPTQLDGVSVRSSLLRAETDGETKSTVEHEYRLTDDVLDLYNCVYALSYHEVNEESIDRLRWNVADAMAYEIVSDNSST